jgi:hypothetical protein
MVTCQSNSGKETGMNLRRDRVYPDIFRDFIHSFQSNIECYLQILLLRINTEVIITPSSSPNLIIDLPILWYE